MIEQYKIDKAADDKYPLYLKDGTTYAGDINIDSSNGFKVGVKWAEGQISEDLMSIINLDGDEYTDGEVLDKIYEYLDADND